MLLTAVLFPSTTCSPLNISKDNLQQATNIVIPKKFPRHVLESFDNEADFPGCLKDCGAGLVQTVESPKGLSGKICPREVPRDHISLHGGTRFS